MFGNRRRRAASNPHLNGSNANPSAATAAAQAFLKSQSSNASLSSAAAAAALRSLPTTPTSVADVQTKRMLRRTGSTSSIGSSKAGSARGPPGSQLERRGSSGSMSERTFRDPSPSRSQPVPSAADAPPVPSIPKNMQQTAVPANSHRRATSLEAAAMRVASPPQNKASGRGSSLGPTGPAQSPRRAGQKMPSMSSLQELTGVERPSSRGSVNFSLPTSSRPASSVGQRQLTFPSPQRANPPRITSPTNQNLVYDPHTRSFLPEAEILAIEQRLWDVANKPVKKKKRIAQNQATGTHLASGTIGGRPRGMAVDAMEAAKTQPPKYVESAVSAPVTAPLQAVQPVLAPERQPTPAITQTTTTPKKKTKKIVPQRSGLGIKVVSDSDSDQASYAPNSSDNESDVGSRPTIFNTRAGSMLAKKPSIVREDREREEEEDETPKSASPPVGMNKLDTSPVGARTISPSPLLQATAGRGHGRGQASASAAFAEERQHTRSASQPAPIIQDPAATMLTLAGKGSIRGGRVQSVSPPRTTHFATTPDNLVVRHQPPPRSVSPRKSALKHSNSSNSPRGPSPVCDIPGARGVDQAMSEASNDSTVNSEDQLKPRKKSVRVSFDETNVVVGEAAAQLSTDSPMVASPQTNRPWFSIGRGKQKDVAGVEDDDEVMKPRPALPSFGSVRERKPSRELEERQLVKPAEPVETKPAEALPPPPLFTTPTGEVFEYSLGQSNDDVVGAILSQDAASKNEANISKSREPLPPQVTSVEGSGYNSDSDSSAYSDENRKSDVAVVRAESLKHGPEGGHADTYRALASPPPPEPEPEEVENRTSSGGLSEIAIPQATPTLEGTSSRRQWSNVPGSWDNSTSESSSQEQEENDTLTATPTLVLVEHHATESTLATIRISEPTPEIYPLGLPTLGLIAAENSHPTTAIMEDTEESDANDSIYSDAAEDLLDFEGDGFMSLDAVVDNLVVNSTEPGLAITTPDSPTTKETKERAYRKSQLSRKSSEPDLDEGWGKAQEYWKGLSAEKKRQLEEEAREEVEGSDTEVEVKPTPKPKKKQKAAIKPSAIEVPARNQPAPRQDRSYMIAPGTKADPDGHTQVMRSSMRPGPSDSTSEPHIRKSMRGSGSMRHSLRASSETVEPRGSLQKKYRPMFYRPVEVKADPLAVNRHVRNLSAASAAAAAGAAKKDIIPPAPVLRRQSSGDSDSSFKRARPSNQGSNFRRSMRSLEQSTGGRQQSPIRSSRFSLRSLSPTGSSSRQPFSRSSGSGAPPVGSPQTQMRSSMRSSYDSAPSLRGANSSKRGKSPLRIPGFGRSSSKQSPTVRQRPQRSSRFADSSDEDEDRPVFRSRFVDSTDEDEPLPARSNMRGTMRSNQPVRSIPRRAGVEDGDSSDLPDSDDEKSPPLYSPGLGKLGKKRTGMNGTAATTSAQGVTLASGPLQRSGSGRGAISSPATTTVTSGLATRQNNSRRGSFMSILRRKKPDPSSKVRKSDAESPARRDTPLERSKSDLQAVKRQDSGGRPMSPRLQKRNPLSMENSETWPLPVPDNPPRILSEEDGRPFTADGGDGVVVNEVNGNGKGDGIERPDLGTRRFTATGVGAVDLNGVTAGLDGKGGKKKKFGALRRMFRLND